jgi:tRNA(fMet)-specific endonuclease VapC
MSYLLDSNVCVQFLRNKNALVVQRINARQTAELSLCPIVLSELYYGCLCSAKPIVNRAKVDAFIRPYVILPFDAAAAETHGEIRHHLESQGKMIGPYDSQIAAIALVNKVTLVTHNTSEFSRVPGLALEDWELP